MIETLMPKIKECLLLEQMRMEKKKKNYNFSTITLRKVLHNGDPKFPFFGDGEKNRSSWRSSSINIILTISFFFISITTIWCQSMQVGIIDFYGPRSNDTELKSCLPFKENDIVQLDSIAYSANSFFEYKQAILDCIKLTQPKIKQADVTFICCAGAENKWMAFIGVSTKPKPTYSNTKTEDIKLPPEITETYDSLESSELEAILRGENGDDRSEGYSLSAHLPSRKLQEKFIVYAEIHLSLLKNVIRNSKYPHQRAVASTVIAYNHDKAAIINDLLEGAKDNEEEVRNNAIRAIGVIVEYSQKRPNLIITISPDPFIALMNSISWTDRNKSASVLLPMSEQRDSNLLSQLKREALESLIDMANWKSDGHSYMGYLILGRIAGIKEEALNFDSFMNNKSEMINKVITALK